MLVIWGHYSLLLGILSLCFQLLYNYFLFNSERNFKKDQLFIFLKIYFILITSAIFSLLYAYITSNFYLINVIEHSHSKEALLYKICGLWGNHEGSMLLWCWILSLYTFAIIIKSESIKLPYLYKILNTLICMNLFFVTFTFFTSNPFITTVFLSLEGTELNPILQDPGLAIHPPILYLGYIGSIVLFSVLIAYIINSNKNNFLTFIELITFWTVLSWTFLTFGITLGSWWAYYELGWGGWWFWDPVENASLIPWLTLTALLHSIIVSKKQNRLHLWTIVLIIYTFLNSLSGTFFVRSGLLTSVHSFANDNSRGIFILLFLSLLFLITIFVLFLYLKKEHFKDYNYEFDSVISRDFFIYLNNLFLLTISVIILFGSFGPVIYKSYFSRDISIGAPFYNNLIEPLLIPFLTIMIISIFLNWKKTPRLVAKYKKKHILTFFILNTTIITMLMISDFLKNFDILSTIILMMLIVLINSLIYYSILNKKIDSVFIGHLGFCIFLLAVTISTNLQIESVQLMKPGDSVKLGNYEFILRNINYIKGINYNSFYGDFLILSDFSKKISILFPEKRFYLVQGIYTTKAAIHSNFLFDFYTIIDDGNLSNGWYTRIYYSPFMPYLWYGALLMGFSGLYSIFKSFKKQKILYWI